VAARQLIRNLILPIGTWTSILADVAGVLRIFSQLFQRIIRGSSCLILTLFSSP